MDIINSADIDFAIVGHMHYFADIPARQQANNFPVVLGSNDSATRVDIDSNAITIHAYDSQGNTLMKKRIEK